MKLPFSILKKQFTKTVEAHHNVNDPSLDAILEADQWARQYAHQLLIKRAKTDNTVLALFYVFNLTNR